ncbi:hypothetical protein H920_15386 [Fukomys damarensis]|uniref:Uncharacterized protein n=1 Tax=Fukomys damarensis TaxID=885580 RepID=A0A091DKC2_FUKDA|nr:hypothetical protein H920_15386 [Fukomys damarensis]
MLPIDKRGEKMGDFRQEMEFESRAAIGKCLMKEEEIVSAEERELLQPHPQEERNHSSQHIHGDAVLGRCVTGTNGLIRSSRAQAVSLESHTSYTKMTPAKPFEEND